MTRNDQADFDGYRKWLGISERKRPPTHYELLGISLDEDDPDVIQAAAEQRRRFVESKLARGLEGVVTEIVSQINEAELTLLTHEVRRDYDKRLHLFSKRRRERRAEPFAERPRFESRPGRTVGEESGIVGTFAGVMAVLVVGMGVVIFMSGLLPWGGPADKKPGGAMPAVAVAPAVVAEPAIAEAAVPNAAIAEIPPDNATPEVSEQQDEWRSLFNGTDLTGWRLVVPPTTRSKPNVSDCWTVDTDRKVLVAHGSKRYWTHWLATEEQFDDFVLSLEWRFPPGGTTGPNGSGVVVRSSGFDQKKMMDPQGVEIDLRPAHGLTGRIGTGCFIAYDATVSNRTGTAAPKERNLIRDKPPGPTPAGGWNTCEITCHGDRLTVVMNGERVNEGWDLERTAGAICLRSQKSDVEFRNIRIRRLSSAPESSSAPSEQPDRWLSLFDGQTLDGWTYSDPSKTGYWTVRDGAIVTSHTRNDRANLITTREFDDFDLEFDFWLGRKANSGVYLRGRFEVALVGNGRSGPTNACGGIWGQVGPDPARFDYRGAETWNSMRVHLAGDRVTVWLNDKKVVDRHRLTSTTGGAIFDTVEGAGPIMLQKLTGEARFRNIRIRPISRGDQP